MKKKILGMSEMKDIRRIFLGIFQVAICWLLSHCGLECKSQTTFFKIYNNPLFERAFDAIETEDGSFILVGERASDGMYSTRDGLIIKLDSNGDIVTESQINQDSSKCVLNIIKKNPCKNNEWFIAGAIDSAVGNNIRNSIFLGSINDSLALKSSQTYHSNLNDLRYPWQAEIVSDSLIYLLCDFYPANLYHQISVMKVKLPSDSISTYNSSGGTHIAGDILYLPGLEEMDIFYYGQLFEKSTLVKILRMDKSLNILNSKPFPDFVITCASATFFTDTSYIFTATTDAANWKQYISTYLMNLNDDTIKRTSIQNNPDTVLYAGGGCNTVKNGNYLYITGVYNLNPSTFPWQTDPTWIQVIKTDLDLHLINQHFFGGNAEYFPYSISPTSDGGVFVTGFTWDYTIPGNLQWDVFAIKTDSTGTVVSTNNALPDCITEAIVCPNPGSGYFEVILGVQHKAANLVLCDLSGKIVLERMLINPQTRIETGSLYNGVYVYRISAGEKLIGAGKWVKQ